MNTQEKIDVLPQRSHAPNQKGLFDARLKVDQRSCPKDPTPKGPAAR
jgi:hypothetical protein